MQLRRLQTLWKWRLGIPSKPPIAEGGWVVKLAGADGAKLEAATTTEFAAMMIYKASSDIRVSPVRFYETNDVAMADIERCAEEEAKQPKPENI